MGAKVRSGMELFHGDIVWACAYDKDNNDNHTILKQIPVEGIILDTRQVNVKQICAEYVFCRINKQGNPVISSAVNCYSRYYARTQEECVNLYNGLINKRLKYLKELSNECENELIR